MRAGSSRDAVEWEIDNSGSLFAAIGMTAVFAFSATGFTRVGNTQWRTAGKHQFHTGSVAYHAGNAVALRMLTPHCAFSGVALPDRKR